ncbi:hypothetical protein HELRODRAFT_168594 [Helobdella robusta]|uniref:EF-hand domain-containing protein n=1 Tax=Helobdella robusta TaxID=6412 RepID=T1F0R9_HELRO|nr:hypothetical protein HELRODRAFT_168594 [Helobdella robusta]ESO09585.1 hypothetical protein HELRODRAFT_168594 [Helobdella robusta]
MHANIDRRANVCALKTECGKTAKKTHRHVGMVISTNIVVTVRRIQLLPKFREYDLDNNGYISLDEAGTILRGPPFNFPNDKIYLLLRSFDRDGNGNLDIEEFAGFYAEAKALLVFVGGLKMVLYLMSCKFLS